MTSFWPCIVRRDPVCLPRAKEPHRRQALTRHVVTSNSLYVCARTRAIIHHRCVLTCRWCPSCCGGPSPAATSQQRLSWRSGWSTSHQLCRQRGRPPWCSTRPPPGKPMSPGSSSQTTLTVKCHPPSSQHVGSSPHFHHTPEQGRDLIDAHSFLPGNALDYAPSPARCRRPATLAVRSPGSCYAGRLPQGAIKQIHDIRLPPGDNVPRLADAHTMAGFMLPWLPLVLLCWRRRTGAPVQCPEGDSECARFCPVGLVALHGGARGAWMTYQAFSENATGANAGTKGTI